MGYTGRCLRVKQDTGPAEKKAEIEEKVYELCSDTHRYALRTSEIMESVGVDADRSTYIKALKNIENVKQFRDNNLILWILPRMRPYRSLEDRITELEEQVYDSPQ